MFFDPADFPLVKTLEANWEIIRDEYLSISPETFDHGSSEACMEAAGVFTAWLLQECRFLAAVGSVLEQLKSWPALTA